MLTHLRLHNFKSWADTGDNDLKPITGLFGANSSGKTSLLQAILLLKQTCESADRGQVLQFGERNSIVRLGDYRGIIHGHADDAELMLALGWRQERPLVANDPKRTSRPLLNSRDLGLTTHVRGINGVSKVLRPAAYEFAYSVGDAAFGMRHSAGGRAEYELFSDTTDFEFEPASSGLRILPPLVKCYGFPDEVRAYYQNAGFLSDLELAFEDQLNRVFYLGPLRAYPERTCTWSGAKPSDMGQAGEQAVHAIRSSRDKGATISRGKDNPKSTLEAYVAEWLVRLGMIAEFHVEAVAEGTQIFQVRVRKEPGGTESLITDVGFGVSQILPVIVLCFYVPEGSTVILEQPEIHLHPAVQAGLADVLIDAQRRRGIQIIVESHSEHLLRRLQRRIAEEDLSSDDVALYFCEAGQASSTLTTLELDRFGNIANWPKDFFGVEFGEIAATQEAIIKRKQHQLA